MKILKKDLDPAGKGFFTLKPENPEDMWHAYNLVQKGDLVTCATFRKVRRVVGPFLMALCASTDRGAAHTLLMQRNGAPHAPPPSIPPLFLPFFSREPSLTPRLIDQPPHQHGVVVVVARQMHADGAREQGGF